jgi:hypothetical protein
MPSPKSNAITLARTLATEWANQSPWTDRGDFDSDDAIGQVADVLDPKFEQEQASFLAELEPVIGSDLSRKLSDFLGRVMAHSEDGGYLFGLAVGQLVRVPSLAPPEMGNGVRKGGR